MPRYVASIEYSSLVAGKVFAAVHPGGVLSSAYTIAYLGVWGAQETRVRVMVTRYATKATGGILCSLLPLIFTSSAPSLEIRKGEVSWPVNSHFAFPDQCRTDESNLGIALFNDGQFKLSPNHTMVVETLDPIPSSVNSPLVFNLIWDE
jgi:hypothetical protein